MTGGKVKSDHENTAFNPVATISRVDEDIGKVGRGFIAGRRTGDEIQDAAIAIDPTSFAQLGAIGLVAGYRAAVQVHVTIEGIDSPTEGCRAVNLVGGDCAAGQRQNTIFTRDPPRPGRSRTSWPRYR